MAITQQQFDELVADLERDADSNPQWYKVKLGAFALLGYCYIVGVLLLLLAAIAAVAAAIVAAKNAVIVKLAIPLIVLVGVVLKALWVKLAAPVGQRLTRRDHAVLFRAIDEIRAASGAPRVSEVLLTNELNAAIVQLPRLGLLGWHKNYLILGLPLMQMLSLEEFKAVLAHEFGHLSGAHGRFGAWIYRVRATWSRLNDTLHQAQHWGRFLFVPFFDWYAPKFAAYSFVQARQQEYEADALAANTVGAETAANALVRVNLKGQDLDQSYWPSIYRGADDQPTPAAAPFTGLLNAERRGLLPQAKDQLRQALQRKTNTSDTHPCLSDRIAALGRRPSLPPPLTTSAAEALFGNRLPDLVARLDREWHEAVAQWWRDRHAHVQSGRAKLAEAAARPQGQMNDVELYEYAMLVEEFDDRDKALDLYKTLVVERGAKQGAKFAYARLLLEKDGATAIALLEEVMRDMPEATMPACDLIVGYLHAHGRQKEAQSYIERYYERQQHEYKAQVARATISTKDRWLPSTLTAQSRAALSAALEKNRQHIKAAYLVRKQTPAGEPSLHVVAIVRRSRLLKFERGDANQRLVDDLAAATNAQEEMLFITLEGRYQRLTKLFKKVAGARIV